MQELIRATEKKKSKLAPVLPSPPSASHFYYSLLNFIQPPTQGKDFTHTLLLRHTHTHTCNVYVKEEKENAAAFRPCIEMKKTDQYEKKEIRKVLLHYYTTPMLRKGEVSETHKTEEREEKAKIAKPG